MKVLAITATCGRHRCVERTLRMFLEQDYRGGAILLIFNNSEVPQRLKAPFSSLADNLHVELVNQHISYKGKPYDNLGDIYIDALSHALNNYSGIDAVSFMDDDDIFLPNHISEGVKGLKEAHEMGMKAYKPARSYFRDSRGVSLMSNNLEPSIFVDLDHIKDYGFSQTTTEQHLQWLDPLIRNREILVKEDGVPTLIYNWGDDFPTYKTSGNYKDPNNFHNYRAYSADHGDLVISPSSKEEVDKIINLVK